jgi:probable phosphoglycerate mutase
VRLLLIRHALPHRVGGVGGSADPELTELGHRQADRVARVLLPPPPAVSVDSPIEAVYTSSQRRSQDTAAPLLRELGHESIAVPELAEFDVDSPHYIPFHEMEEGDPDTWKRMRAGLLPAHVDAEAFRNRVLSGFEQIISVHPGAATVACFLHAGVINILLSDVLGLTVPLPFPLDYAGITRLTISRSGRRAVRTVNEIGHVADLLDPTVATSSR